MLIEIVISPQTVLIGEQATAFYQFLTRMKTRNHSIFYNSMKLGSGDTEEDGVVIRFMGYFFCEQQNSLGHFIGHFTGNKLGEGSFGEVFDIHSTVCVTPSEYKAVSDINSPRVLKLHQVRRPWSDYGASDLFREYEIAKDVRHINFTYPTLHYFDVMRRYQWSLMDKAAGKSFDVIFKEDREQSPLTLHDRMTLLRKTLQAAEDQVARLRIIHQDLKPENLMVSADLNEVKIIDYGLGVKLRSGQEWKPTFSREGTFRYLSPEILKTKLGFFRLPANARVTMSDYYRLDPKRDSFALAKILVKLFGWSDEDDRKLKDSASVEIYYKKASGIRLNKLFCNIPRADKDYLKRYGFDRQIKALLLGMLNCDLKMRLSIEEANEHFESIYENFLASQRYNNVSFDDPVGHKGGSFNR